MASYELIGRTLGHSFSKQIHQSLGAYSYALRELPTEDDLRAYFALRAFAGCNVTIPYKTLVMPLLDAVDKRAKTIGSVNTVVNNDGHLTGYNTDYDGFTYLLASKNISLAGKHVLILGTGGTSRTIATVSKDMGAASITFASRHPAGKLGHVSYKEAQANANVEVIVNASPSGMYPANAEPCLLNLSAYPNLEAVVDVVYNPLKTRILYEAKQLGIPHVGGLGMLVAQAVAAARLFTNLPFGIEDTKRIQTLLQQQLYSLVLVGMPSSGKTRLGQALALHLDKPFVDLDIRLEEKAQRSIPEIFAQDGEDAFRKLETEILKEETAVAGRVIATGGGVVTQPQNHFFLGQNAVVICVQRPLDLLQTGGARPLSASVDVLAKMQKQRAPLYAAVSDASIENTGTLSEAVNEILEAYYAHICS